VDWFFLNGGGRGGGLREKGNNKKGGPEGWTVRQSKPLAEEKKELVISQGGGEGRGDGLSGKMVSYETY